MEQANQFVNKCMELLSELERQARDGFTEVILRNPQTGEEVIMKIPQPPEDKDLHQD